MTAQQPGAIRVLVVEDSRVVAEFLTHVLQADPSIQVVGVAFNGEEAIAAARGMKPDVITMDIHMPKVDGFEATRKIMETCPAPIVIVSGSWSVDEVAFNFRAIEAGALAVVARPNGIGHPNHAATAKELVDTVKLMSEVKVVKRWPRNKFPAPAQTAAALAAAAIEPYKTPERIQVVAIGASTGGPLALQTILAGLPRDFPLPLLIVQHMTPGFAPGFVEWLANSSGFAVRVAVAGESLLPGHAYVAPDDFHMGVRHDSRIMLADAAKESGVRPSVSFLLRSVGSVFGSNVIGIVLTGMGRDGAEELLRLRDGGAITIAQDEKSSVVHGMPGEAIQIGAARHILPPEAIAKTLAALARRP
jgi:two-component system chemotaxis response regulator CheB